ncbi:MAG: DUF523 domain-containing protein [Bacilli bacterium]|nr:DUF523 domain-containing protein [Bacilli bacterium]
MEKEKILISACLLGTNCKYNGKNNYNSKIEELKKYYDLLPICPETDGGLPTPRVPSERNIKENIVITADNNDVTKEFNNGAKKALNIANVNNVKIALLKDRSPSCGSNTIYDGTFSSTLIKGKGVTAELLANHGVEIYNEEEIDLLIKRKNKVSSKKYSLIKKMTLIGILSSLTFLITLFLQIPLPLGSGYLNLSDLFIFITADILNPLSSGLVGLLGASLADILSGYAIYAPFTALIKFSEGFLASLVFKNKNNRWSNYCLLFVISLLNPLLYTIPDFLLLSAHGMLANIPFNLIQGIVSSFISSPIIWLMNKRNISKYL